MGINCVFVCTHVANAVPETVVHQHGGASQGLPDSTHPLGGWNRMWARKGENFSLSVIIWITGLCHCSAWSCMYRTMKDPSWRYWCHTGSSKNPTQRVCEFPCPFPFSHSYTSLLPNCRPREPSPRFIVVKRPCCYALKWLHPQLNR